MSDVIDGSPMAHWLWSLFFKREESSGELRLDEQTALPTHYFVSDRYISDSAEPVTVASLAAEIKTRHPSLTRSVVGS